MTSHVRCVNNALIFYIAFINVVSSLVSDRVFRFCITYKFVFLNLYYDWLTIWQCFVLGYCFGFNISENIIYPSTANCCYPCILHHNVKANCIALLWIVFDFFRKIVSTKFVDPIYKISTLYHCPVANSLTVYRGFMLTILSYFLK